MHSTQNIETYKAKLESKVKDWNAEAEKLQAKAHKAGADAEARFRNQMAEIRRKEAEARAKLTEFGSASKGASDELKSVVDKAVNEFSTAVDQVRAQFH